MTADAVSPELHGPLLALHRHAEGLLASHRRIEATGNLAVGSIELLEGTFAAKRRSVAAQSQADERNLALIGHIETTVDRTQRMVYGDYELPPNVNFTYRHIGPKKGSEGYVESIDLQSPDTQPVLVVTSEKLTSDNREGLIIVAQEDSLVAAGLTRVSKKAEEFALRCAEIFGSDHHIIDVLAGEFDSDEELELLVEAMQLGVESIAQSSREKEEMMRLLSLVPRYVIRDGGAVPIDMPAIDRFRRFIDSLVSKK